jgi:hypothetical protein
MIYRTLDDWLEPLLRSSAGPSLFRRRGHLLGQCDDVERDPGSLKQDKE